MASAILGQTISFSVSAGDVIYIDDGGVGSVNLYVGTKQVAQHSFNGSQRDISILQDGTASIYLASGSCEYFVNNVRYGLSSMSRGQRKVSKGLVSIGGGRVFNENGDEINVNNFIYTSSNTSCIGDSILAYGMPNTPSTGVLSGGSYSNSHISWLNSYLMANGRTGLDVTRCYAVGGVTLQTVISNQLPLALIDGTDVTYIHAGVNNLNSTSSNYDGIDTIMAQFKILLDALSAVKKAVLVDSINPILQSGSTSSKSRAGEFRYVNAALRDLCSNYVNVIYVDTYSGLVDNSNVNYDALANMLRTDDGIHFVSNGAKMAGYTAFSSVASNLTIYKYKTESPLTIPPVYGTSGGTSTAGSGSVTGTIPASWNIQVISGSAAVTASQVTPDKCRLAITNAGGTASTVYLQVQASVQATLLAALSLADTIQAGFSYSCSSNTLLSRIAASVRLNANGSAQLINGNGYDSSALTEPTITYSQQRDSGVIITPPTKISERVATLTQVEFIIQIQVGASTGATTMDIFNPFFNKLV